MEKSLRLPSYTLPFSPSKLDTTIAELFLHDTFRNLGVGGNPSLRFIVKIVTSTRIFSSAGDNTVIIPPLDRWTDRQREFTLVRTQSGVVHFDLHRDFGPLPPSNRSSRNFIFDKYFHFDQRKKQEGGVIYSLIPTVSLERRIFVGKEFWRLKEIGKDW